MNIPKNNNHIDSVWVRNGAWDELLKTILAFWGAKEKNIYDVRLRIFLVLFEWKGTMQIECNGHNPKKEKKLQ